LIDLSFPAGATTIVYDPTTVSGQDPVVNGISAQQSGVATLTFSAVIFFAIFLISLLF